MPKSHSKLPSYQEMRASAYKDQKANVAPQGGPPSNPTMYQPIDMNKMRDNLPTSGNEGISAAE